ncbi:hypothetical protein [Sandarakinorhabdus sp. DWP1-3-1]|uniref:hypothetical protein n=1 Tax=Sandarakinorhabdus sp. DWP1-3-1 TaxID=2804627 RepID=UPI003CF931F1
MRTKNILALLPLLTVGACAQTMDLGNAVDHNVAVQTVDMTPKYAGVPIEGGNGHRSAEAYKRYLAGTVKKPDSTGSRNTMGGGSPQ